MFWRYVKRTTNLMANWHIFFKFIFIPNFSTILRLNSTEIRVKPGKSRHFVHLKCRLVEAVMQKPFPPISAYKKKKKMPTCTNRTFNCATRDIL